MSSDEDSKHKEKVEDLSSEDEYGGKATSSSAHAKPHVSSEGFNIAWESLTYTVQTGSRCSLFPPRCADTRGDKTILDNLSGFAGAGRVLAIMGPSGCGKTTFLDILAGRVKSGSLSGDITVNGEPLTKKQFKRHMAYVMQEDTLVGDLTVRENLYFSALLRLPLSISIAKKKEKVEQIITELGLSDCANTAVGTVFRRGISGGQRRRVSIGMQLITDPSVIFLDEPTSGLDSKSAASVVDSLVKLAREYNRTIICTIHSPSSQVFQSFDDVMLLSRGKLIYCGPTEESVPFFASQGLKVGRHVNPADYFLDVINYDFEKLDSPPKEVQSLVDAYPQSKVAQEVHDLANKSKTASFTEEASSVASKLKGKYATPFWWQTFIVIYRTLLVFVRNPGHYWARLAMYVMLSIMMGTLYLQIDDDQDAIQDRVSVLFFSVAFLTFMSIAALPAFIEDRLLFVRERMNGAYRVGAYALAHTIVGLPFILLIALLFSLISYFMIGLKTEGYGYFLLGLFLSLIVAESLVTAISAIVPNFIMGIAFGAGLFGMFMLCCGFFVRATNIPPWWIWAHYISFHKYTFEAYMYNEFEGESFPCDPMGDIGNTTLYYCAYPNLGSDPSVLTGEDILKEYEYEDVKIWAWYLVLLGMFLFYRIVFYLLLRFLNKGKR
ncbi:ABC transporter domain-containing protein [Balamuthia mandrillaris]